MTELNLTNLSNHDTTTERPMTIDLYDTEDMNSTELQALPHSTILALIDDCTKEIQTLENQYYSGDRDIYPPDWYDQYVVPVQCIKRRLEDAIENMGS